MIQSTLIIITTMDLYKDIEEVLQAQQSLLPAIVALHSSGNSSRTLRTQSLTHHQILSQIYEHLKNPFQRLKLKIDSTWHQDQEWPEEGEQQIEGEEGEQQIEGEEGEEMVEQGHDGMVEQEQDENEEDVVQQQQEGDDERFLDEDGPISDDDIGLYGEQLDEEEMESYEHEEMEDDPEFGNYNLRNYGAQQAEKGEMQGDDHEEDFINENFEQFREIQMKQTEAQDDTKNEIDIQIDRLEANAMSKKDWALIGEVKARERPVNSLLDTDLNFKSGLKFSHQINDQYNLNLEAIIKQRILDEVFDDRTRNIEMAKIGHSMTGEPISKEKSKQGLAQLYEIDFKNHLGLGQNKDDKLRKDIIDSLKELSYHLDSLSNVSFTFKPSVSLKNKNGSDSIVAEEKVPITRWDGTMQESNHGKAVLESEKEVDKKGKRLKNKRIARQRKKEQDKKKTNRLIEYGGVTKHEAEARKKIAKTKLNAAVKYDKSNKFFDRLNNRDSKPGKPNPNLSKLKI